MATGGQVILPRHLTYSKSRIPILGALIDYMDTSFEYLRRKTFAQAEKLHAKATRATLSASFMATVCLMLGLATNVKFEVVTFDEEPLVNDLHFMLLSKEDNLYIDDIDITRVMWCLETSDLVVILLSCLLVWNNSNVRSPLSEYLFLPWLGVILRGLFMRQGPTAGALLYTMAIVSGNVNPLFLTAFSFLFRLANSLASNFEDAVTHFKNAANILETRIKTLENPSAAAEDATVKKYTSADPFYTIEGEIKELKELLPEIQEKIQDMMDYKAETIKRLRETLCPSNGAGSSSGSGGSSSSSQPKAAAKPASDISHLIKRKRKASDTDEPSASAAKRSNT